MNDIKPKDKKELDNVYEKQPNKNVKSLKQRKLIIFFKNNKKLIIIIFSIIIAFIFIFSVIFSLMNMNNSNILDGISINGIDVSGMSKEEAISTLNSIIENKSANGITISYETVIDPEHSNINSTQITSSFENLNINYNISAIVNEAYNLGRSGNIFQNNFEILGLMLNKKNLETSIDINIEHLTNLSNDISANLPNKIVQNSYYIEDSKLVITSGTSGNSINIDDLYNSLYCELSNLSSQTNYIKAPVKNVKPNAINIEQIYNEIHKEPQNAYYEEDPFKVYTEVTGVSFDLEKAKELLQTYQDEYIIELTYTSPDITINDLGIDIFQDLIATYTTKYDVSNKDRTTNLQLASSKINGTIISPGDEFSYNATVGERTISAGYKEAKIYSNGEVVDGLGGGICQVSSTLYNSVVFANLDITERYNHQFVTSYVPAGRDATVVYGIKDFKFVNTRSYPIKIVMSVNSGIVTASIYGIKENTEYKIDFDVNTISVTPPSVQYKEDNSLPVGKEKVKQKGANGQTVQVYKLTKLNGTVISKTQLSLDTYSALAKIILIGTISPTNESNITESTESVNEPTTDTTSTLTEATENTEINNTQINNEIPTGP